MNNNYGSNNNSNPNYGVNNNGNPNYGGNYNNGFNNYNNNFNNNNMDPGYGYGVGSLVCGIVGLVLAFVGGSGLIPSIIGLILAIMSGSRSATVGLPRNGMATGGLVCSLISIGLSLIVLISCIATIGCAICSAPASYWYY